ncbi:hypothetical protein R3P38DRAFT_2797524 [Favolaschia claudopus]|uniref:F-box domain-containing protein n=1 Tax=Favolaschia claudopus TaxID=2862362 RepID=A0AAW0A2E3_9AGAR
MAAPVEIIREILFEACGFFAADAESFNKNKAAFCLVCRYFYDVIKNDSSFWEARQTTGSTFTIRNWSMGCAVYEIPEALLYAGRQSVSLHAIENLMLWLAQSTACNVLYFEFRLWTGINVGVDAPHVGQFLPCSRISTLIMQYSFFTFRESAFYDHLLRLHIGPLTDEVGITGLRWDYIKLALRHCSRLTHLIIDRVQCIDIAFTSMAEESHCLLPAVTHLALNMVILPSLTTLKVDNMSQITSFEAQTLDHLDNPAFAAVRHLVLRSGMHSTTDLVQLLRKFAKITHFDMTQSTRRTSTAFFNIGDKVVGPLCPELDYIFMGHHATMKKVYKVLCSRGNGRYAPRCTLTFVLCAAHLVSGGKSYRLRDNGHVGRVEYLPPIDDQLSF